MQAHLPLANIICFHKCGVPP